MKCDTCLEITGMPVPISTPIPICQGWNLVSYLPDFALPTGDAVASIYDDIVVVLGYDEGALTYIPGDDVYNTLDYMAPCFGYWIKSEADGDLIYPVDGGLIIAGGEKRELGTISAAVPGVNPSNQWMNLYSRELKLDGNLVGSGSEVTAHALDGAQIGGFTIQQPGLFGFMAVYADDPGTSIVEGVRSGEEFYLAVNGVPTNETFVWTKPGDNIEIIAGLTAKDGTGEEELLPGAYSLSQNYPNPFNPSTTINFSVPAATKARVEIYNILGNRVATIFDGVAQAGDNTVVWDGNNEAGEAAATGIYFYRLTADNFVETKKMTLMK
jgi:hypothetical protein